MYFYIKIRDQKTIAKVQIVPEFLFQIFGTSFFVKNRGKSIRFGWALFYECLNTHDATNDRKQVFAKMSQKIPFDQIS